MIEKELESTIAQIKTAYEQQLKDQKTNNEKEINDIKDKLKSKETEISQLLKEKETQERKISELTEQINKQKIELNQFKIKINEIEQQNQQGVITFSESSNSNFDGIVNYLRNKSNSINFSASSILYGQQNCQPSNVSLFNDKSQSFFSDNKPNSWICLDFNERRVIPTGYKIRTVNWGVTGHHPRNWKFQGSTDNRLWTTLDEENNCLYTKEDGQIHYFNIKYQKSTKFRYLRILLTGPNWTKRNEVNHLIIDSLEIYGELFE